MPRYKILINPHARTGGDRQMFDVVREAFAGTDHVLLVPGSYDALCEAARAAVDEGVETVVVVGGDGTVNAVANQLAGSHVALAVVPAGTANDLARQLGMPLTPREACLAVLAGHVRTIDLARVNGQHFVTGGGLGVVAEVAVGVQALKARPGLMRKLVRALGGTAYSLYSFGVLAFSRRVETRVTLTVDGVERGALRAIAGFVNNQPTIGRSVTACPETRPDDGRLGYCLMAARWRPHSLLTAALFHLGGAHRERPEIELGEGQVIVFTGSEPLDFIGDGELLAQADTLRVEVVPGALRVVAASDWLEARVPAAPSDAASPGAGR